jgi:excisionase family DNA binding protein
VDDLLTTRQLQELLQVDRITIYRMLNDGRLPGFKVGGQWRFSRAEIDQWLQEQRSELDIEGVGGLTQDGDPLSPQALPLTCLQMIQDVCAEALNIAVVTADLDGHPLSTVSNSCAFCDLILSTDTGRKRCAAAWRRVEERDIHYCHAGLLCASAPVRLSGNSVAITSGCQFTLRPDNGSHSTWQPDVSELGAVLGLSERALRATVDSMRSLSQDDVSHVSKLVRQVAGSFSEMGQERIALLSRLQHIARVSTI